LPATATVATVAIEKLGGVARASDLYAYLVEHHYEALLGARDRASLWDGIEDLVDEYEPEDVDLQEEWRLAWCRAVDLVAASELVALDDGETFVLPAPETCIECERAGHSVESERVLVGCEHGPDDYERVFKDVPHVHDTRLVASPWHPPEEPEIDVEHLRK